MSLDKILVLLYLTLGSVVVSANQTTTTPDDDSGLGPGDVASIVLGVFFLLMIIITVIVLCLYCKGYLQREESAVVMPVLPEYIHTTPESLRQCTDAAIKKSKETKRGKQTRELNYFEPIIYIHDDVFHPPNSRPLPSNHVPAVPYSATSQTTHVSTKGNGIRKKVSKNMSVQKHKEHNDTMKVKSRRHSRHSGETTCSKQNGDVKQKQSLDRLDITTYYGTQSPYMDPYQLAKTH